MTNECKHIQRQLADFSINELSPIEMHTVNSHLQNCPTCQNEYHVIQRIQKEADRIGLDYENIMTSIDWEKTAETISNHIPFKKPTRHQTSWLHLSWKWLAPAMASIFLFGILLGYFLFYHAPTPPSQPLSISENHPIQDNSLNRLENSLARKEVVGYFQQSQLVLTNLMNTCENENPASWKNNVDMSQVRTLLKKNRYFNQNLNDPSLSNSKLLLNKIEWLLYELSMADEKSSCEKLQQLQDYIRQERLLFKIRLVGKELSSNEI